MHWFHFNVNKSQYIANTSQMSIIYKIKLKMLSNHLSDLRPEMVLRPKHPEA